MFELLLSIIILKGRQFVNTEFRIYWSLQTEVILETPTRSRKGGL